MKFNNDLIQSMRKHNIELHERIKLQIRKKDKKLNKSEHYKELYNLVVQAINIFYANHPELGKWRNAYTICNMFKCQVPMEIFIEDGKEMERLKNKMKEITHG